MLIMCLFELVVWYYLFAFGNANVDWSSVGHPADVTQIYKVQLMKLLCL